MNANLSTKTLSRPDAGGSLVGVLAAVALLGAAAIMLMQSFSQHAYATQNSHAQASFRDVEVGLGLYVLRQIKAYARETGCNPAKFDTYFSDKPIGHWGLPRLVKGKLAVAASAPEAQVAAAARCSKPTIAGGAGSEFHFCLAIERVRENEPSHSFLAGNRPFVEIRVSLQDLPTGGATVCSGVWAQPTAGYAVTYGAHWGRFLSGSKEQEFYKHMGWYHAAN